MPCRTLLAGNRNSYFLGNDASITAGSISAVVRDSEAIWYNPAGLGGNSLTRLDLSGTVFMLRLQEIPNGVQTTLPSGEYNQNVSGNEYFAAPAALTFARKATDKLSYGFGIYVPAYEDVTYNTSMVQGNENFPDIAVPTTYTQGFDLDALDMQYNIGGAIGYELRPNVRIGFAVFGLYDRLRFNRNLFENIESDDGKDTTSLFYTESVRQLVSTIGVRATAGLQWDITEKWKLGLVVFSPTFQVHSWGQASATFSGTSMDSKGAITQEADRLTENIDEWGMAMVEPFHSQIAFGKTMPDYWIGITADFFLPLKKPNLYIDDKFMWNITAGSKFKVAKNIDVGVGIFTDNSQKRKPTELGDLEINYYGLTFGTELLTPIKRGDDNPIVFLTTFAARYALGIGNAGGLDFDAVKDGNISDAKIISCRSYFHELSLYIGTSLFF